MRLKHRCHWKYGTAVWFGATGRYDGCTVLMTWHGKPHEEGKLLMRYHLYRRKALQVLRGKYVISRNFFMHGGVKLI